MEVNIVKNLINSVYSNNKSKAVLTTVKEQRDYEDYMNEAIKDSFAQDAISTRNSWTEAQTYIVD